MEILLTLPWNFHRLSMEADNPFPNPDATMNTDDLDLEIILDETTPASDPGEFCREAYWAGVGAALAGETLAQAIQAARESGCPFGEAEERSLRDGFRDATNYRRDRDSGNDNRAA